MEQEPELPSAEHCSAQGLSWSLCPLQTLLIPDILRPAPATVSSQLEEESRGPPKRRFCPGSKNRAMAKLGPDRYWPLK